MSTDKIAILASHRLSMGCHEKIKEIESKIFLLGLKMDISDEDMDEAQELYETCLELSMYQTVITDRVVLSDELQFLTVPFIVPTIFNKSNSIFEVDLFLN